MGFIGIFIVLFLLILAVMVSTFLFLGVGYIFSMIVPLSIFQSTVLAISSVFVVAFCIAAIRISILISHNGLFFPPTHLAKETIDEEYDGEDQDDEEYEDRDTPNVRLFTQNIPKIGRNEPCPCGSGLKYRWA